MGHESDIVRRLKRVVMEKLKDVTEAMITPEARFINELGADSLERVDLVMGIEDEFGIEIPDEDAEEIETFGGAERYIEACLDMESLEGV